MSKHSLALAVSLPLFVVLVLSLCLADLAGYAIVMALLGLVVVVPLAATAHPRSTPPEG